MSFRSLKWVAAAAAAFTFSPVDASAQVKAGPEFRANTYTTGIQATPATAVEPDGDFIVVWYGAGGQGESDYGVFGQRYARDGSPRGGEFRANTFTTGDQLFPTVAVNARGNFVVIWQSRRQNGYRGIFGQRYDATGARVGGEFQVNSYTTGYLQDSSGVVMDAKGGFVVVWTNDHSDGFYNYGVRGQRFDASGARLGAEFQVNSYTTGFQEGSTFATQIAGTPDGRFVVVWRSEDQDGSGYGVFGQRFDANGRVGAEFQVNTYTTGNQQGAVGMAADGRFVVVWNSNLAAPAYWDIRGQRYNADGTRAGAEFQASAYTLGNQFVYGVAVDNQANFVVAWDDFNRDGSDWGLFGQRFSSTATPRGAEFQVNTYTTGYQRVSLPRSDEVGNFLVAWRSLGQDGNLSGVFGQRFGGLFPVALAVDTTGNRVLEPGETVNVVPTWRNHVGSPQAFTGTLTGMTGPAGAVYTIADDTANHGTVPDNGISACGADCYAVSVSNPTPRPVPHWDASALESIAPDTQGQQKRWALHVGGSFTDVPTANPFYRFIETVFHHGITGGCSPTQYCPGDPTTRAQMAVFVLVAKDGVGYVPPACGTPMFADVPASSPFCRWIEELARRAVVTGCGGGNYCPSSVVSREQMAVFVLRMLDPALNPPACGTPVFADVPASSPFCRWIEELARRGVVTGCGGGNYCPTAPVTRGQMAVFIVVTFGLSLYGP